MMSEQRESFVFYASTQEAIGYLPDEVKLATYEAIIAYALRGELPDPQKIGLGMVAFSAIKPNLDANNRRYQNGKKGGRPKQEPEKPVVSEDENSRKPNDNVTVNENENETATENGPAEPTDDPAAEDPSCETVASAKSKTPYQQIVDAFHRICASYRKVEKLSESRKKAIHARFSSGYAITDFIKLFELAEASDFLKGANQRNFTADFDWLIKDANMAKTLEGNYANRDQSAPNTGDSATGIPDGAITARRPKYGTIL